MENIDEINKKISDNKDVSKYLIDNIEVLKNNVMNSIEFFGNLYDFSVKLLEDLNDFYEMTRNDINHFKNIKDSLENEIKNLKDNVSSNLIANEMSNRDVETAKILKSKIIGDKNKNDEKLSLIEKAKMVLKSKKRE